MANQVPYTPFPQGVEPSGVPNDYQNVNPNPAAFGSQVAGAESQLGGTLGDAGQKQFQYILAKNDLTNELYANDATTNAMQGMADRYGDFAKLRGKAAVDAFPQYRADIQKLYQAAVDSAPNLASKAMLSRSMSYLHDSYQRYGQFQQDREFKSWQNTSAIKATDSWLNQAMMSINDLPQAQVFVNSAADQTLKLYEQNGYEIDQAEAAATQTRSKGYSQIIGALVAQGPAGAAKASEFFDSVKTQMDAPTVESVDKALKGIKDQQDVNNAVTKAIQGTGTSPTASAGNDYLSKVAQIESDSGKASSNIYQFKGDTAKQYGITDTSTPEEQKAATLKLKADNTAQLNTSLGRAPTDAELYLAHQQGAGGAAALIQNPDAPASSLTKPEYIADNTPVVNGKQIWDPKTVTAKEFTSYWEDKYNGGQSTAVGQAANDTLQPDRAQALQTVMSDPSLSPEQRVKAGQMINQTFDMQQIAQDGKAQENAMAAKRQELADNQAIFAWVKDPAHNPQPDLLKMSQNPVYAAAGKSDILSNLISMQKAAQNPPDSSTSKAVFAREYGRIPQIKDESEINNLISSGQLTREDGEALKTAWEEDKSPQGITLAQAKKSVTDLAKNFIVSAQTQDTGARIPEEAKYGSYLQWIDTQVAQYRKDGKDPHQTLFKYGSKDYVGSPEALMQFMTSDAQGAAQDMGPEWDKAIQANQPAAQAGTPDAFASVSTDDEQAKKDVRALLDSGKITRKDAADYLLKRGIVQPTQ